jgi:hypothetical protein
MITDIGLYHLKNSCLSSSEKVGTDAAVRTNELLAKRGQTNGHIHEIQRHRELEYQRNSG